MSADERIPPPRFTLDEWDRYEERDQRAIRGVFYGVTGAILMAGGIAIHSGILVELGSGIAVYGSAGGAKNAVANAIKYELVSTRDPSITRQTTQEVRREWPEDTV